jgi:hypothetical protein
MIDAYARLRAWNRDEKGLANLSKRLRPEQHLHAGTILKRLGVSFDFGFMLLEPDSTFEIVRNNIEFLDAFVGDGWTVASFCRMLPYAGTPIQRRMADEGRLLGTAFEPDYRFLDPRLDLFYAWMLRTFHERNFTSRGLCHLLKSLNFEARLQLGGRNVFDDFDRSWAQHLTALCNGMATNTLRRALEHVEATPIEELQRDGGLLDELTRREHAAERELTRQVVDFYWSMHERRRSAAPLASVGGFAGAWTHAESTSGSLAPG